MERTEKRRLGCGGRDDESKGPSEGGFEIKTLMLRMETRWSGDETMVVSIDVDVVGGEGDGSDAEI